MPDDKAQKLKEILTLLSDSLTRKDFELAFSKVVEYVKGIDSKTSTDLSAIKNAVDSAISRIEKTASEKQTAISKEIAQKTEDALNDIQFKVESLISEAQAKLDSVKDGEDADEDYIVDSVIEKLPTKDDIVSDVLKKIPKPDPVDLSPMDARIKALDERLSGIRTAPFIGPSRGVFLKVNGVKQGIVSELNIVGSGVSITKVNGLPTVTITGGGSGSTAVEEPTGAVNGVNTAYTVTNAPLYIIVDGISKFETTHYTYLAGAITITDGAPPTSYIRSIYSA